MEPTWPEVIKYFEPHRETVSCAYEARTSYGGSVLRGTTAVNHDTIGKSNLVFCTRKGRYKPGYPLKLTKFQARRTIHSATDSNWKCDFYGTPNSAYVNLTGRIAGMYGTAVPDVRPLGLPEMDETKMQIASMEARAKVNEEMDGDVGLMIIEGKQTLKYLSNPLGETAKGLKKLLRSGGKRKKGRSSRELTSMVSAEWLKSQFALLPLMADIEFLMSDYLKKFRATRVRRTFSTQSYPEVSSKAEGYVDLFGVVRLRTKRITQGYTTYNGVCHYRDNWNITDAQWLSASLGLDFGNIANLVWEKIPFSFVIDWIFDVGTWLRAVRPTWHRSVIGGSVSMKQFIETRILFTKAESLLPSPKRTVQPPASVHFSVQEILCRKPYTDLPDTPVFSGRALSNYQILDSLALSWQSLERLAKKFKR